MPSKKPTYIDLYRLDEDDRIRMIVDALVTGKKVGGVTDSDPSKAKRYLDKIRALFPTVRVISRGPGPVQGAVSLVLQGQNIKDQ